MKAIMIMILRALHTLKPPLHPVHTRECSAVPDTGWKINYLLCTRLNMSFSQLILPHAHIDTISQTAFKSHEWS